MILGDALADAVRRLDEAGVASPEVDARLIAAHLLGTSHLMLDRRGPAPAGFEEMVARRESREPLQHILGTAPFGHLDLAVGSGVFTPRPETEVLADWAVRQLSHIDADKPLVVDLCTGSGALAQYIASLVPEARVVGVEKQVLALDYARRNAPDAEIVEGDVTEPILGELYGLVDLVVTNPPYVPETGDLQPEVYADPHEAVFGGADGMSVITKMTPLIVDLLRPGGVVGLEHDDSTSQAVQDEFQKAGLIDVHAFNDLAGRPRFVSASKL